MSLTNNLFHKLQRIAFVFLLVGGMSSCATIGVNSIIIRCSENLELRSDDTYGINYVSDTEVDIYANGELLASDVEILVLSALKPEELERANVVVSFEQNGERVRLFADTLNINERGRWAARLQGDSDGVFEECFYGFLTS